jgi:hypothetical protein
MKPNMNNPLTFKNLPAISFEEREFHIQRKWNLLMKWNINKHKAILKGKTAYLHDAIIYIS